MTDSSLDDFFAKKDKTKKKTKVKPGAVGDVDASTTTKPPGKKDKNKKDKDKQSSSSGTLTIGLNTQEDEEWKDFEEEKKVDYTGLRIQTLQISKEEQDREAAEAADNGHDEDDNKERRDGASGPWNKTSTPTAPASAFVTQAEPVKEASHTPKAPAKYVPPAQRHGATSAASSTSLPSSRKKKEAPNVHSEEDFPTLGGTGGGAGSSPQYSSRGSSDVMPTQRRGISLTLGNKFSALQD